MEPDEKILDLLREIRDGQREHLAEYRRVTQRSLELQQQAVSRQEQVGTLYRRMALGGVLLIVPLLALLALLLLRWGRYLLR